MFLNDRSSGKHDIFPPEVESILAKYRDSVHVPEASPDFMPRLWERIERQQKVTYGFRRLASGFVTAAAAFCLVITAATLNGNLSLSNHAGTYVDLLADDTADDAGDPVSSTL